MRGSTLELHDQLLPMVDLKYQFYFLPQATHLPAFVVSWQITVVSLSSNSRMLGPKGKHPKPKRAKSKGHIKAKVIFLTFMSGPLEVQIWGLWLEWDLFPTARSLKNTHCDLGGRNGTHSPPNLVEQSLPHN